MRGCFRQEYVRIDVGACGDNAYNIREDGGRWKLLENDRPVRTNDGMPGVGPANPYRNGCPSGPRKLVRNFALALGPELAANDDRYRPVAFTSLSALFYL